MSWRLDTRIPQHAWSTRSISCTHNSPPFSLGILWRLCDYIQCAYFFFLNFMFLQVCKKIKQIIFLWQAWWLSKRESKNQYHTSSVKIAQKRSTGSPLQVSNFNNSKCLCLISSSIIASIDWKVSATFNCSGDQDSKIPLTQTRMIANVLAKELKLVPFGNYAPWYDKKQVYIYIYFLQEKKKPCLLRPILFPLFIHSDRKFALSLVGGLSHLAKHAKGKTWYIWHLLQSEVQRMRFHTLRLHKHLHSSVHFLEDLLCLEPVLSLIKLIT